MNVVAIRFRPLKCALCFIGRWLSFKEDREYFKLSSILKQKKLKYILYMKFVFVFKKIISFFVCNICTVHA